MSTMTADPDTDLLSGVATSHAGVSIDPLQVVVVEVATVDGGQTTDLVGFGCAPVPDGVFDGERITDVDGLARVVAAAWRIASPSRPSTIHAAVAGPSVTRTVRPVPHPSGDPAKDERALKSAMYGLTSHYQDVLREKLPPGKGMNQGLTANTRAIHDVFASAGFELTAVVPSGVTAAVALPPTTGTSAVLMLDGDRVTGTILSDGNPLIVRTIDGLGRGKDVLEWMRKGPAVARPDAASSIAAGAADLARRIVHVAHATGSKIYVAGPAADYPGVLEALNDKFPPQVTILTVDSLAQQITGPVALTSAERTRVSPILLPAIGAAALGASGSTATLPT